MKEKFWVFPSRVVLTSLIGLAIACGYPVSADDDESQAQARTENSSTQPALILTQPEPYRRAQEYIQPGYSMSTLSGTPFTGGWGGNRYGGGTFPYQSSFMVGAPYFPASLGQLYSYDACGGWGNGYISPNQINGFGNSWGGELGNPFTNSGNNFAYGRLGGGFPRGNFFNGYGNGYQPYGNSYRGWGGGYPSYGNAYGPWGGGYNPGYGVAEALSSGTQLGLTTPSHVVQTEPSKASGNYYAPSTVDTTASGSYYAQTDSTAVQVPLKHNSTDANYWKPDGGSNYWGSGGGSAAPFGKDLNSVPWNK